MTKEEIIANSLAIDGWFTPEQTEYVYELAKKYLKPNGVICELGVWKGKSTYVWAAVAQEKDGSVIAIDTFYGVPNIDDHTNTSHYGEAIESPDKFLEENAALSLKGLPVKFTKSSTDDAFESIEDNSLDICFVDADHSYESVLKDIEHYLPKVKVGGILCGHDYGRGSVNQAVKEALTDFTVINDIWLKEIK